MKKKFCLLIFTLLILFYSFSPAVFATNSYSYDISYFEVKVVPRYDTSLSITHNLKVNILDCSEPVNWIKLEISSTNIDEFKPISKNISEVTLFSENDKNYIRINLNQNYSKGDVIELKYSFHQSNVAYVLGNTVKFNYSIGGFSDINVEKLKVYWNAKDVIDASTPKINSSNYLVWDSSLPKQEKFNVYLEYGAKSFQIEADENSQSQTTVIVDENGVTVANPEADSEEDGSWWSWPTFLIGLLIGAIITFFILWFVYEWYL